MKRPGVTRVLAALLMLLAMLYIAVSAWGVFHSGPLSLGFDDNDTIVSVAPGSSAARAEVRVGDRLVEARTPLESRALFSLARYLVGTSLQLAVERKGVVRLVSVAVDSSPAAYRRLTWISIVRRPIAALICLLGGALLLLRPQRATWAFFLYALLSATYNCIQYLPYPWILVDTLGGSILPLVGFALLYFAVSFLHDERRPWHGPLLAVAAIGSLLIAVWNLAQNLEFLVPNASLPFDAVFARIDTSWAAAQAVATLAVLVEAYWTGRRARRQRIAWVVAGIAFAAICQVLSPYFINTSVTAVLSSSAAMGAYMLSLFSPLVVCLAVIYAMTQYRVVDLRFALNRTLVYAVTTSALVALFALVDWAASRLFEGSRIEVYASIGTALLVGFTLNAFHGRVESIVDFLFFRRERRAAERLKHLAASLQYVDDEATIGRFIVDEPIRLLDIASAAVFTGDGGEFRLGASAGWGGLESATIARSDELVPQLRAATSPLWLRDVGWHPAAIPHGAAEPLVALPIKARADLFGIVLYGGHTTGATLNAEERELLSALVSSASSAFDHIEAERARSETARARADVQRLSAEVALLRRLQTST